MDILDLEIGLSAWPKMHNPVSSFVLEANIA